MIPNKIKIPTFELEITITYTYNVINYNMIYKFNSSLLYLELKITLIINFLETF